LEQPIELQKPDLLEEAYAELRGLASRVLLGERANHTLRPTDLVHEAWLRLVRNQEDDGGRLHFIVGAARVMRQVLVDHARRRRASKRGGSWVRVTLSNAHDSHWASEAFDAIALDEAIRSLSETDSNLAHLAELRLFAGLSMAHAAEVIGVPLSTAKNHWAYALALLSKDLRSAT
jgi:RNA polymerase sigma factor (TIGR02999 family)